MVEPSSFASAGADRSVRVGPVRGRPRGFGRVPVVLVALGFAGEAVAAPVTVGLGLGADVPGVTAASELGIDRGDPLGVALTVPVLVGRFRAEPRLTWTALGRAYGTPPPGFDSCSGTLTGCWTEDGDSGRTGLGLSIGPWWSIGQRGRLWAGLWGGTTYRRASGGRWDRSLGADVGGEFFLAGRFSFGLDVLGTYTSVEAGGTRTTTITTARGRIGSRDVYREFGRGWTAGIDGLAAFRLYLN